MQEGLCPAYLENTVSTSGCNCDYTRSLFLFHISMCTTYAGTVSTSRCPPSFANILQMQQRYLWLLHLVDQDMHNWKWLSSIVG